MSLTPHQPPRRCAIVGAGIVGAGVAQALACRGWEVVVLEQESHAAASTSSLPVALAVPQVSADDAPRSRLIRLGIAGLKDHAQRYLQEGQDWAPSGVLERRARGDDRWHASGLWIKPARLVHAWLAQANISLQTHAGIRSLHNQAGTWSLRDVQGQVWGGFEVVVLANAMGCKELLQPVAAPQRIDTRWMSQLASLHGVHGLMSHGHYPEPWPNLPAHPINGKGCFVPALPDNNQARWVLGSTFVTDALQAADIGTQHAQNLERLRFLLPQGGADLIESLNQYRADFWSGTRCTTRDRFPVVGPIPGHATAGLWICTAMGSRALSLVTVCTDWLASEIQGDLCGDSEVVPLARHFHAHRWLRQPTPCAAG